MQNVVEDVLGDLHGVIKNFDRWWIRRGVQYLLDQLLMMNIISMTAHLLLFFVVDLSLSSPHTRSSEEQIVCGDDVVCCFFCKSMTTSVNADSFRTLDDCRVESRTI